MTIDPRRRRDIAAIHVMAAQLGMDTSDRDPQCEYRAQVFTVARTHSVGELDYTALQRVKAHFQALCRLRGIKAPSGRGGRADRPRPAPDREAMVRKIRAILGEAGRADEYADGLARRMFNVQRYEWCTGQQLHSLVAALVADQRRRAKRQQPA